jgi:choline dehydrogenase-like flavoprotein
MSNEDYDIVIIGSGPGGGTLARHLAPSGKSILLLEPGDWLKREAKSQSVWGSSFCRSGAVGAGFVS